MEHKKIPAIIALNLSLLFLAGCEQSSQTEQNLKEMSNASDTMDKIKEETNPIIENKTEAIEKAATELLDTSKEAVDNAMN